MTDMKDYVFINYAGFIYEVPSHIHKTITELLRGYRPITEPPADPEPTKIEMNPEPQTLSYPDDEPAEASGKEELTDSVNPETSETVPNDGPGEQPV